MGVLTAPVGPSGPWPPCTAVVFVWLMATTVAHPAPDASSAGLMRPSGARLPGTARMPTVRLGADADDRRLPLTSCSQSAAAGTEARGTSQGHRQHAAQRGP